MTPLSDAKRDALRFRIWQFCEPREWNVTSVEIAEALDESPKRVARILHAAGWGSRVRVVPRREPTTSAHHVGHIARAAFVVRDVLAGRVQAEAF